MDEERILIKISQIEQYLDELQQILPEEVETYLNSIKDRRAVERVLQITIENVIDICAILVKEFHLGPPNNEENILDLLHGKISNIKKLKEMKGFRNFLVHRYDTLDDRRVFDHATNGVSDIESFIQNIKNLLKNQND